jgi:hypothetical protein
MAKIDSPLLGDPDVKITFDRPILTASQLYKSTNWIEVQKSYQDSYRRADVLYSERAISISFTQPLAEARKRLELRVSCEPLALQMTSMALICKSLAWPALFLGVEELHLIAKRPPSNGQDDNEPKQWLEIIYHFRSTKWAHVAGDHSTNILRALQLSNTWREAVLPALHKLNIQAPEDTSVPLQEAVLSFTYSHKLISNFIGVEYGQQPRIHKPCRTGIMYYTQYMLHTLTCLF